MSSTQAVTKARANARPRTKKRTTRTSKTPVTPRMIHPMQIGSLILMTLGSLAQLAGHNELAGALIGSGVLCGGKAS